MNATRRAALGIAATLAAASAAGCGMVDEYRYSYAQESAETIYLDAMTATLSAESLRVSGSADAKRQPEMRFSIMTDSEDTCGGRVSFATADFDLAMTPQGGYLKGSPADWEMFPRVGSAQAGREFGGRWVKLAAKEAANVGKMCRLTSALLTKKQKKDVDAGRVPRGLHLTQKGLSEVDGVKTVKLNVADDRLAQSFWISLEEPHRIVKLVEKGRSGTADVVFSDYDFPVAVSTPKGKDVLDLGKRNGRSG